MRLECLLLKWNWILHFRVFDDELHLRDSGGYSFIKILSVLSQVVHFAGVLAMVPAGVEATI